MTGKLSGYNPVLLLLALLAAPNPAPAQAADTWEWLEMPDPHRSVEMQTDSVRFQDLEPGVLLFTEYDEIESYTEGRKGFVTVRTGRETVLTVLFYSTTGTIESAHRSVAMEPARQVSLSLDLPPFEAGGVIYLVAWDAQPVDAQLAQIAQHPYGAEAPVEHVLATATFARSEAESGRQPWEDEFRQTGWPRLPAAVSGLPELVVRVDPRGVICSKDCTVQFRGRIETGYDDWGGLGRLLLSNPEPVLMKFMLAPDLRWSRASLRIYGPATTGYGNVQHGLEVVVNNWSLSDFAPMDGPLPEMKQFQFEVGHYLQGGYNLIELRQPATSGLYWPVERIELWLE